MEGSIWKEVFGRKYLEGSIQMERIESIVLSNDARFDSATGQLNLIGVLNGISLDKIPCKTSFCGNIFLTGLNANCTYTILATMHDSNDINVLTKAFNLEANDKPQKSTGLQTVLTLHITNQKFTVTGDFKFQVILYKTGDSKPKHITNIVVPVEERGV